MISFVFNFCAASSTLCLKYDFAYLIFWIVFSYPIFSVEVRVMVGRGYKGDFYFSTGSGFSFIKW